jgi:hypothetical protein
MAVFPSAKITNKQNMRRFTILDGLILIAVIAIGLAGARWHRQSTGMPPAWWGVVALQDANWIGLISCLAMVPLRLHGTRPRLVDLWRQPGWIACIGVGVATGVGILQELLSCSVILLRRPGDDLWRLASHSFTQFTYRAPQAAFIAVVTTWAVLALSGHWKPEKSWIDRLGRILGAYWVVHPFLGWAVELISAG